MLEQITDSVVDWGASFGLTGLALISASEATFQPVPPDLLVIPMSLEASSDFDLLAIFLVVTLSSVIGSLGGYAIGLYAGRPAIDKFFKNSTSKKLDELISRYGVAGVFIAAVSPIPYKLLAWTAGAGRMEMRTFLTAGVFGRGIRFGIEVLLLGYWGEEFVEMLQEPIFWALVGLFSIVVFIPLNTWWNDLDSPVDELPQ
tara:strand:+ start:818 stop:1420 length:603 start_codon:yes stop_codon:yes gene_type:complete